MNKEIDLIAIKEKILISQFARQELGCKVTNNKTMCCHLHKENSPSLHFNDEKKFYYCFGCHKSGDIFSLIQEIKNCSFSDAIKLAADYAGISLTNNYLKINSQFKEEKELLYKIMEDICIYFQHNLNKQALDYLKNRQFNQEIIKKFRLGYCPNNIDNLIQIIQEKYKEHFRLILESGIIRKNSRNFYCILSNRLIFPIFNKFSQVIAFGGRIINNFHKKAPKYINASDSLLFKKSEVLYGENFALPNIKKNNEVILVEGYFDVIALYSIGVNYAVASLGTTISEFQLNYLWNFIDNIKCAFDGDPAGYRAMIATIKKALNVLNAGKFLCFTLLAKGSDPASLIMENKQIKLLEYLNKVSYPAEIIWKITWLRYKNTRADFIAAIRQEVNQYVNLIKDDILKIEYKNFFDKKINDITGNNKDTEIKIESKYKNHNFDSNFKIKSIYEDIFCYIITLLAMFPNLRQTILNSKKIIDPIYQKSFHRLELKEMLQYAIDHNFSLNNIFDKFPDFKDSFIKSQKKINNLIKKEEDLWLYDVVYRLELISLKEQRKNLEIALINENKDYYDIDKLQKVIFRERELLRIINNE